MSRWQRGGEITAKTWSLMRENRQLMRFATMATVVGAVVGALGVIPAALVFGLVRNVAGTVTGIVLAFAACWLATFLALRYIAGLVWCADRLLKGQPASYEEGLAAARGHTKELGLWALITVAVSWLLQAVQGAGDDNVVVTILRTILAALLAAAWGLITFFVLPIIVLEHAPVGAAMKRSIAIIRQRWGEAVVGSFRIGVRVGLTFILPGIVAIVAGVLIIAGVGGAAGFLAGGLLIAGGIVLIIIGSIRQMAARQVFGVALYQYAAHGLVVGPFGEDELAGAVTAKKSRSRRR